MDIVTVVWLIGFLSIPFLFEGTMFLYDYGSVRKAVTDDMKRLVPLRRIAGALLIQSARRLKHYARYAWEIHGLITAFALGISFVGGALIDHPAVGISEFWITVVATIVGAFVSTGVVFYLIPAPKTRSLFELPIRLINLDHRPDIVGYIILGGVVLCITMILFVMFLEMISASSMRVELRLYFGAYYLLFIIVTCMTAANEEGVITN